MALWLEAKVPDRALGVWFKLEAGVCDDSAAEVIKPA